MTLADFAPLSAVLASLLGLWAWAWGGCVVTLGATLLATGGSANIQTKTPNAYQ